MKLSPKIDMILSLVQNQALNWSTALSEFVDNSLGPDAGNASHVTIRIEKNNISISDNGDGFRDINALYQLGSGTSRESGRDIGLYGIGSKQAQLWIGSHINIATVREGLLHRHAIHWPIIWKDNGPALQAGADWPDAYEGKGRRAAKDVKGSDILISWLHPGKPALRVPSLVKSLGLTYAPALRGNKRITIIDTRRGDTATEVKPDEPPAISDWRSFHGAIRGMPYDLFVGRQDNYESRHNALFISWGHRVIRAERNPFEQSLPSHFYGRLHLSDEWKACLSANKLDVVSYKEELLADAYQQCKELIALYESYERELRLDVFMGTLAAHMGKVLKVIANSKDGEYGAGDVERKNKGSGGGDKPGRESPPEGNKQAELTPAPTLPLRIVKDQLGKDADKVDVEGPGFAIRLNVDIPYVASAFEYPFNTSAVWGLISSALAAHLVYTRHKLAAKYADMEPEFQASRLRGELLSHLPATGPQVLAEAIKKIG